MTDATPPCRACGTPRAEAVEGDWRCLTCGNYHRSGGARRGTPPAPTSATLIAASRTSGAGTRGLNLASLPVATPADAPWPEREPRQVKVDRPGMPAVHLLEGISGDELRSAAEAIRVGGSGRLADLLASLGAIADARDAGTTRRGIESQRQKRRLANAKS